MRVALFAGVGLILFLGIFPGSVLGFIQSSVGSLTNVSSFLLGMVP